MGVEKLEAITDRGYFNNEEIKACEEAGITTYLPKPQTSTKRTKGYFSKDDFIYHWREDHYECPAGQRLVKHTETMQGTQKLYKYWTNVCGRCAHSRLSVRWARNGASLAGSTKRSSTVY